MVRQCQQPSTRNSFESMDGVLKTAHSLFERYKCEQKLARIMKQHPEILDQVTTEICRAIALYIDDYNDDFRSFAQQFALAIWSLLTQLIQRC
ncbi:unnamed protein product [Rotaria sp. Silwood2]|nr:unnamed protein product [Rotaria sp. Silwood2]CAF2958321.1 unnamed protein product [Rotaria sp. Silwood2]CAF3324762.1 unnamed protein product [Rotaria sp. Silwood2]CAF4145069.1 unnamed protein product [Rotaria sp. Silwood2]CAF4234978.1 unnamed protein product [Rotaria sp. Silwood2]